MSEKEHDFDKCIGTFADLCWDCKNLCDVVVLRASPDHSAPAVQVICHHCKLVFAGYPFKRLNQGNKSEMPVYLRKDSLWVLGRNPRSNLATCPAIIDHLVTGYIKGALKNIEALYDIDQKRWCRELSRGLGRE